MSKAIALLGGVALGAVGVGAVWAVKTRGRHLSGMAWLADSQTNATRAEEEADLVGAIGLLVGAWQEFGTGAAEIWEHGAEAQRRAVYRENAVHNALQSVQKRVAAAIKPAPAPAAQTRFVPTGAAGFAPGEPSPMGVVGFAPGEPSPGSVVTAAIASGNAPKGVDPAVLGSAVSAVADMFGGKGIVAPDGRPIQELVDEAVASGKVQVQTAGGPNVFGSAVADMFGGKGIVAPANTGIVGPNGPPGATKAVALSPLEMSRLRAARLASITP